MIAIKQELCALFMFFYCCCCTIDFVTMNASGREYVYLQHVYTENENHHRVLFSETTEITTNAKKKQETTATRDKKAKFKNP